MPHLLIVSNKKAGLHFGSPAILGENPGVFNVECAMRNVTLRIPRYTLNTPTSSHGGPVVLRPHLAMGLPVRCFPSATVAEGSKL